MTPFLLGTIGSFCAGMMTAIGALPVLAGRHVSARTNDILLGFAAGVMLSAAFFSLILPGLDRLEQTYDSAWVPASVAVVGILLGAAAVFGMDKAIPHRHFVTGHEGPMTDALRRIWLFVIAITIHNIPEGLAVGIGFGSGDLAAGTSLAIGIGLQNAPEGLAVAVALLSEGYRRKTAFLIAAATGMVEPLAGVIGAAAITYFQVILPWGLMFAAGAMIFVISHEIIPETHRRGHHQAATAGLMIGLVVMLFLDVSLG